MYTRVAGLSGLYPSWCGLQLLSIFKDN